MDKLELFNAVLKVSKPIGFKPLESLDVKFVDTEVDSLDVLIVTAYLCELYGIEPEADKKITPSSPQEIFGFLETHKTREPSSIEEAVRYIK